MTLIVSYIYSKINSELGSYLLKTLKLHALFLFIHHYGIPLVLEVHILSPPVVLEDLVDLHHPVKALNMSVTECTHQFTYWMEQNSSVVPLFQRLHVLEVLVSRDVLVFLVHPRGGQNTTLFRAEDFNSCYCPHFKINGTIIFFPKQIKVFLSFYSLLLLMVRWFLEVLLIHGFLSGPDLPVQKYKTHFFIQ